MNNEIKEINLPKEIKEAFNCIDYELSVCNDELPKIRDYITNLQEEYRQTKLLKERYQLEKEDYKSRNEKAIEKIKKIQENAIKYGADHDVIICQDLLNILQGEDK